jgi:hypothetical protein
MELPWRMLDATMAGPYGTVRIVVIGFTTVVYLLLGRS